VTTLIPVVNRLRNRFGTRRVCILAARGMIRQGTLVAPERPERSDPSEAGSSSWAPGWGRMTRYRMRSSPGPVETGSRVQEARMYAICPAPETVDPEGEWRDRCGVGMAITERTDPQRRCRLEAWYDS
jgi:hypothetical protein